LDGWPRLHAAAGRNKNPVHGYRCVVKSGRLILKKSVMCCNTFAENISRKYRDQVWMPMAHSKKEDALDKINSLKRFNVHSLSNQLNPGLARWKKSAKSLPYDCV